MLKILIVEDEVITATDLKETLEKYQYNITGIARNYREVREIIENLIPDIVLIDIHLKNSSFDGVEIASLIRKEYGIPCVFLTANAETATFKRAQESKPAAYLLKPYRHKELAFQIELAFQHYRSNLSSESDPSKAENLFLPLERGHQRIVKSDVIVLKAEGSYVKVFVNKLEKPYLFSMNLGYISQFFTTTNFYQVSRSFVVNLHFLDRFDADNLYLRAYDEKIPVPQNRRQEFLKKIAVIKTP